MKRTCVRGAGKSRAVEHTVCPFYVAFSTGRIFQNGTRHFHTKCHWLQPRDLQATERDDGHATLAPWLRGPALTHAHTNDSTASKEGKGTSAKG